MQTFVCASCGQMLFFENSSCLRCGSALGFVPERLSIHTLEKAEGDTFELMRSDGSTRFRRCAWAEIAACNWLVSAESQSAYCLSCALTESQPPKGVDAMAPAFRSAEMAKRRLVAQLLTLGLSFVSRQEDRARGLGFSLLAPSASRPVLTGHANGLITLNLAEADDVFREQVRRKFDEPYRTLLGHFRHEVGHYYFSRLIADSPMVEPYRTLFGDERKDYSRALRDHYGGPTVQSWKEDYVSAYAAVHPWEDWAETFAHYLHIRDVLETSAAFGVSVRGPSQETSADDGTLSSDPARITERKTFDEVLREWLPLTYALNAINRSMGKDELYPFLLSPKVIEKLTFVHDLTLPVRAASEDTRST